MRIQLSQQPRFVVSVREDRSECKVLHFTLEVSGVPGSFKTFFFLSLSTIHVNPVIESIVSISVAERRLWCHCFAVSSLVSSPSVCHTQFSSSSATCPPFGPCREYWPALLSVYAESTGPPSFRSMPKVLARPPFGLCREYWPALPSVRAESTGLPSLLSVPRILVCPPFGLCR